MIHEEVKGQLESKTHQEMGVEETLLEEPVGIRDFQVKEGALPEEMVIREEEEVMMILTLVMMGMEMVLPPQTPLPQGKENIKSQICLCTPRTSWTKRSRGSTWTSRKRW